MEKEKDDFSKDVENILRKSIEINKHYLKQSTELMRVFGQSGGKMKNLNIFQPKLVLGALTSFTNMNLDHYKNMLDLGFALTKEALSSNEEGNTPQNEDPPIEEPSFTLSATVAAGDEVNLQFLLENVKKEEAICELVHSEYVNVENRESSFNIPTFFRPQSFQLAPGISQTVVINIAVDAHVPLGVYESKVKVIGFEPSYFLIQLTVTEKEPEKETEPSLRSKSIKKPAHGRQDKKRPEQQ